MAQTISYLNSNLLSDSPYYGRKQYRSEYNTAVPGQTLIPVEPDVTRTTVDRSTDNTASTVTPTPTSSTGINYAQTTPTTGTPNYYSTNSLGSLYGGLGFNLNALQSLFQLLFGGGAGGGTGGGGDMNMSKWVSHKIPIILKEHPEMDQKQAAAIAYSMGRKMGYGGGGEGGGFNLDEALGEAQKYADELRAEAQGNYDFVIKYINKAHTDALGQNDQERAKFFELVANAFEQKVGQIPFDYYRRTEREKQDINLFLQEQDAKAQDLAAREQQFQQQQDFEKQQEAVQRGQTFNTRGLLGSGLEQKKAQEQATQRQLFTTAPAQQAFNTERTNLGFNTLERGIAGQRTLEDLATTARRDANTAETGYQYSSGKASRDLASALADIQRKQSGEETNAYTLSDLYSRLRLNPGA